MYAYHVNGEDLLLVEAIFVFSFWEDLAAKKLKITRQPLCEGDGRWEIEDNGKC